MFENISKVWNTVAQNYRGGEMNTVGCTVAHHIDHLPGVRVEVVLVDVGRVGPVGDLNTVNLYRVFGSVIDFS